MMVDDRQSARWNGIFLVFLTSLLLFFIGTSSAPNAYDEALVLTGAMRVQAGQIPHRDFYVIYGPAQFYLLAGLFKIFGRTLLVSNLYDLLCKATLTATFFAVASRFASQLLAGAVTFLAALTLFGALNNAGVPPVLPVSIVTLIATAMLVPLWQAGISSVRVLLAGMLGGLAFLFRYDVGIALFGLHAIFILMATLPRSRTNGERVRAFLKAFWPYVSGFALVSLPVALLYLRVAPLQDFIFDVFTFQAHNYHRYRNLPWPHLRRATPEVLAVYLPFVVAPCTLLICFVAYLRRLLGRMDAWASAAAQPWFGLVFAFGMLAAAMCLKGYVRVSVTHMYLATVPALLLLTVALEHRREFGMPLRRAVLICSFVAAVGIAYSAKAEARRLRATSSLDTLFLHRHPVSVEESKTWCGEKDSMTYGLCFVTTPEREHLIEFLNHHTHPGETVFVGSDRHDKVFANDNLTYFATGLLPAVKWSEYDAGLQILLPIQQEMVQEMEQAKPRYAVISPEFQDIIEPNDSTKSSGVKLLDEYLQRQYEPVASFGSIQVLQRKN